MTNYVRSPSGSSISAGKVHISADVTGSWGSAYTKLLVQQLGKTVPNGSFYSTKCYPAGGTAVHFDDDVYIPAGNYDYVLAVGYSSPDCSPAFYTSSFVTNATALTDFSVNRSFDLGATFPSGPITPIKAGFGTIYTLSGLAVSVAGILVVLLAIAIGLFVYRWAWKMTKKEVK